MQGTNIGEQKNVASTSGGKMQSLRQDIYIYIYIQYIYAYIHIFTYIYMYVYVHTGLGARD